MGFEKDAFIVAGMEQVDIHAFPDEVHVIDLVEQLRVVHLLGGFKGLAELVLLEYPGRQEEFILKKSPQGPISTERAPTDSMLIVALLSPQRSQKSMGRSVRKAVLPAPGD